MQAISSVFTHDKLTLPTHDAPRRFARFAWIALAYNVAVVLWGAFVRASLSGDGCGSHWPLCNGEIIPADPTVKTVIEFSHRVTSGAALLLVVLLVWSARGVFPFVHHAARRAARWALAFTVVEALIGAGLVVFGFVAADDSLARAVLLSAHLVNTLLLLGALALAAWWAGAGITQNDAVVAAATAADALPRMLKPAFACALAGMLVLGVSGAIAALGDTLFPATSLAEAWSQEMSGAAHALVRLRVLHPLIAVIVSFVIILACVFAGRHALNVQDVWAQRLAASSITLVVVQMIAGVVNVLLLAPAWMQLVHLLLADLLWIAFVLLTAAVFGFKSIHAAPHNAA